MHMDDSIFFPLQTEALNWVYLKAASNHCSADCDCGTTKDDETLNCNRYICNLVNFFWQLDLTQFPNAKPNQSHHVVHHSIK